MDRVYRQIVSEILDDIVRGSIPAGSRLPKADDIAARHACSLGSAREAIRALEERRVVEVHAGQGQEVLTADHWALLDRDVAEAALLRHRDPQLLREAVAALRLLETQVAMLAARTLSEGDLALLEQTLDRMRGSTDAQVAEAEAAFHRTLAIISRNRFLASALESLHPVIASVRRRRAPDRDAAVVRAHERIMAALRERDATAAAAAIDAYGRHLASWLRV
jgi:GntR family transcriptional regulator, transcriptional repressor for pyruvate dehydrogenase complex